jgi:hypothetical protein
MIGVAHTSSLIQLGTTVASGVVWKAVETAQKLGSIMSGRGLKAEE